MKWTNPGPGVHISKINNAYSLVLEERGREIKLYVLERNNYSPFYIKMGNDLEKAKEKAERKCKNLILRLEGF